MWTQSISFDLPKFSEGKQIRILVKVFKSGRFYFNGIATYLQFLISLNISAKKQILI